jgi:hypothetical protein
MVEANDKFGPQHDERAVDVSFCLLFHKRLALRRYKSLDSGYSTMELSMSDER